MCELYCNSETNIRPNAFELKYYNYINLVLKETVRKQKINRSSIKRCCILNMYMHMLSLIEGDGIQQYR